MGVKNHYSNAVMRAFELYHRRNKLVYLYGAKGKTATYEYINALFEQYPEHYRKYTPGEKEEIIKNSIGKIAFDCSGFVAACFNFMPSNYSEGYLSDAKKFYGEYKDSRAGCMLFTSFRGTGRHIGIDLGSGMFAHMGNESTNANIAKGIDSVRLEWFTNYPDYWEKYFEHKAVDYTGTSAEVIEDEYK